MRVSMSQRAIVGALPSRIARCRTGGRARRSRGRGCPARPCGTARPSGGRSAGSPGSCTCRRRSHQATSSTIEIAEITRAATSAAPNPVMLIESVSASAASSASASNTRIRRNVVAIVYGRRSAAMTGATTALMTATMIAAPSATPKLPMSKPGRINAARKNATVLTSRLSRSRERRSFGRTLRGSAPRRTRRPDRPKRSSRDPLAACSPNVDRVDRSDCHALRPPPRALMRETVRDATPGVHHPARVIRRQARIVRRLRAGRAPASPESSGRSAAWASTGVEAGSAPSLRIRRS